MSFLGHCSGDPTWADGFLSDLGSCGGSTGPSIPGQPGASTDPTIIVEATQIPPLFWLLAGGFAILMILKRR